MLNPRKCFVSSKSFSIDYGLTCKKGNIVALRLINSAFSPSGTTINLNYVHASTDRCCWLFKYFFGTNGVVQGTVKRGGWFPFACGQKKGKHEHDSEDGI